MPEEPRGDAIEKFLLEQKAVEDRKQALIDELLQQRADALKAFDEKLERLGYRANSGKSKRSHHKPGKPSTDAPPAKGAAKPKA